MFGNFGGNLYYPAINRISKEASVESLKFTNFALDSDLLQKKVSFVFVISSKEQSLQDRL